MGAKVGEDDHSSTALMYYKIHQSSVQVTGYEWGWLGEANKQGLSNFRSSE